MAAPVALFYVIYIADPVQAAAYQAKYPNGVQMAPLTAAAVFGAPFGGSTPGGALTVPATIVPWQGFDSNPYIGLASGILPGTSWTDAFGNTYPPNTFYWVGTFLCSIVTSPAPPANPIGVRRFICGFETPFGGDGQSGTSRRYCRDASRTPDGLGYALRSDVSNPGPTFTLNPTPTFSWERFYVRPRTLPTGGNDMIWSCRGSIEGAGPSLHLDMTPAGQLLLYNQGNGGAPGTLLVTTGALTIGRFSRIDLNFQYAVGTNNGSVQIWINGVSLGVFIVANGTKGLGVVQKHSQSSIGNQNATAHGLECDFDDWVNSDFLDVTTGSHIQLVRPTGFASGSAAAWVGDWRQLLPIPAELAANTDAVISSTPNSVLAVTTDYQTIQLGCACFVVSFRNNTSPSVTAQLGYRIGAAQTLASTAIFNASWAQKIYTVPGTTIPPIPSLSLVFQKDAGGSAIDANGLFASAESLGYFGPEDAQVAVPPVTVPNPLVGGIHNAPYPSSAVGLGVQAVMSPVQVWSGLYVGNNLGQDVITQFPAHWWWVRPLTGATDGVLWWSSMVGSHARLAQLMKPIRMVQALLSSAFQGLMRVAGLDAQGNANGVSYQWVAVSDPGMRFIINGAFTHASALATANNPLIDPAFTPECLFISIEGTASSSTGTFYKGVGHPANQASPLDAAVNNSVIAMAAGALTSLPAAVGSDLVTLGTAYSAWRRSDGSAPGACGAQGSALFDVVTYVGNNAASRNIAVNLGARSPLFALVTPHNGTSYFRDPSHPTTHSSQTGGGDATTAIIGGDLNVVTVGLALNATGITYDVFVIAGTPNPGLWSLNPGAPFAPVCPLPPTGGPFPPAPPIDPTPVPTPTPTPTPIPPRGACYPFSLAISDLANRLQDPNNVHWTSVELGRYLNEALRTFQAYTQKYRAQGTFASTVLAPFYDLPTMLPVLRGYNITDQNLITDIEYALMEPPTPTVWTGTSQFTLNDVTLALQRRLDLYLQETGAVVTRQILAVTVDSSGRVILPRNVVTVRRLAWIMNDANFTVVPLTREDEWAANAYARDWPQISGVPSQRFPTGYSLGVTPPLSVQLIPAPSANGWLDITAVTLGALLAPTVGAGVLMGIPDDWTWVVKFGALADLLGRDGTAYDPQRSAYCEARWRLGIDMATQASVVLAGRVNNNIVRISALQEADIYKRGWQSQRGAPGGLLTTAQNIMGSTPLSDANGPYTFTLDVVANMPVPAAPTDCINVGVRDEDLDTIYDYAHHLALFKEGPTQLTTAMDLYDRFTRSTGVTKKLDQAIFPNRGPVLQQTVQDVRVVPRESDPEETTS